MAFAGSVIGFSDFKSPYSVFELAEQLSASVFGGIKFKVRESQGDTPLLQLENVFMGLTVELSGSEDGFYTLEISTLRSAEVPGLEDVWDLSAMLNEQLKNLVDVEILPPQY